MACLREPYCARFALAARMVLLTLIGRIGVLALTVLFAALPVLACAMPNSAMTAAERECCKKMAGQCGDMGMAKSHPCCQQTSTSSDFDALKTASSQDHHFSLIVFHALSVPFEASSNSSLAQWSSRILYTHGPPGLAPTFQTILRI
jgi:hypothetical protein